MLTEEELMSDNVRRNLLMLDCCEICGTVTEKWDVCKMHNISVLVCHRCQRKLRKVLRSMETFEHSPITHHRHNSKSAATPD